jgi:hypothetical protein
MFMNAREFVAVIKHHAVDGAANNIIRELSAPLSEPAVPGTGESEIGRSISAFVYRGKLEKYRRARWFQALIAEDQAEVISLLRDCANATASHFFAVLDGVGGDTPGVFEVVEVDGHIRHTLNPENSDMLHDVFSEICETEISS